MSVRKDICSELRILAGSNADLTERERDYCRDAAAALSAFRSVAVALLATEGVTLSIPKLREVCTYCNGYARHKPDSRCPVALARDALRKYPEAKP